MNPTETNSENTIPNNTTNETTQVSPVVTPPPSLEVPTPAPNSISQSSVATPSSSGLTSFSSNESSSLNTASTPSSAPISPNPIETIAKKEVVTRPLLWGIVTFLFFTGLVIGGVSLWRLYNERNTTTDTVESTVPATNLEVESTTPANVIDNTPINANPSIQADAIDAEVQAIDTDIETDALSDTQLGL